MNPDWIVLNLIVPLVFALIGLVFLPSVKIQKALGLIGSIALLGTTLWTLFAASETGPLLARIGAWPLPYGIGMEADLFSSLMLVICAIVGLACAAYAIGELKDVLFKRGFFPLFFLLMLGVNGAFLTRDLFNLYVWFEVLLLSSFVLMVIGREKNQLRGGITYVILNLFSSILFLSAAGLLYGKTGTLNMDDLAMRLAIAPDAAVVNSSSILLLIAFGIKAGIFPLFFWLPASYHTPPVAISGLFAGLLTKVGVYALFRVFTEVLDLNFSAMQWIIAVLAGLTMITGVFGAAAWYHNRRILSFHIISQIGYMVMGLALFTPLGLAAGIFYILHHILVKTNLFLIAGMITDKTGDEELKKIGGLYQAAPWLAILFFIPAFSLGGIPPLSGFWAKLAVLQAGIQEHAWTLVGVALGVGILTLFSMTKIWSEAFWKKEPSEEPLPNRPISLWKSVPTWGLAIGTVLIGLAGQPIWELSERAAAEMFGEPNVTLPETLPEKEVLP